MHKRKLLIGLLVAGLFTAGLGAGLVPAAADQRTFQVTFVGGTTTVVTLDLPAGAPLSSVQVPGVSLPIQSIVEITPPPVSVPSTPLTPPTTTDEEPPPADDSDSSDKPKGDGNSGPEAVQGKQTDQKSTSSDKADPQAEVETKVAEIVKATKQRHKKAETDA